MPNTVLGKVSCTPKGDYNEGAAYVVLDIVAYGGGSYMALKGVQGITPSNDGVNWMQLAAPGEKGDKGDTGNTGPRENKVSRARKAIRATPEILVPRAILERRLGSVLLPPQWTRAQARPALR